MNMTGQILHSCWLAHLAFVVCQAILLDLDKTMMSQPVFLTSLGPSGTSTFMHVVSIYRHMSFRRLSHAFPTVMQDVLYHWKSAKKSSAVLTSEKEAATLATTL